MTDVETSIGRSPADLVELPLSALQQRIWFICTGYPGESSSVVLLAHRLRGTLEADAWARAVGAVVDRHESLRALFPIRDGVPVQVIGPAVGLDVERIDLSGLPADTRERGARDIVDERARALLDLEHGPLVSSFLIRLADDDHVWGMTIHHLLADGASSAIVGREVRAYYRAFVEGTDPGLPELPVHYGDFALWQHHGNGLGQDDDLEYWREQLAGVPVLELPTDAPRPAEKGTRAAEVEHVIDGDLTEALERLARTERCTQFMLLLAAFQALLARDSGQDDVCVGIPIAGRTRVELAPLVGLFANTLPLRGDLSGDPTFRELLARTRDTAIDALDRQDVPFGRVVAELDLPQDLSRTQVFQVIFVLHTQAGAAAADLPGLRVEGFPVGSPQIIHDLVLDVWPGSADLAAIFRYDRALFKPATIESMARRYERLLRGAVGNPDARLSQLVPPR
jgi:hypothetical protein